MSHTTQSHLDLLTDAAFVVDQITDIDAASEIGGPMDELAAMLEEITSIDAVRSLAVRDVDMDRVADILTVETDYSTRVDRLVRTTGCAPDTAEAIATLDRSRFRRFATLDERLGLLDVLHDAANETASRLTAAIHAHRLIAGSTDGPATSAVPDTIPADWTA